MVLDGIIQSLERDPSNLAIYYPLTYLLEIEKDIMNTALAEPNSEFRPHVEQNCINLINDTILRSQESVPEDITNVERYRNVMFGILKSSSSRAVKYFRQAVMSYAPVYDDREIEIVNSPPGLRPT